MYTSQKAIQMAFNIAIAHASAEGYAYLAARESKRFPVDARVVSTTDSATISGPARRLIPGMRLTATATLTTRADFIPASLALRNAIAKGGAFPSAGFVNAGAWIRPNMTVNHQASYGTVWGGRN